MLQSRKRGMRKHNYLTACKFAIVSHSCGTHSVAWGSQSSCPLCWHVHKNFSRSPRRHVDQCSTKVIQFPSFVMRRAQHSGKRQAWVCNRPGIFFSFTEPASKLRAWATAVMHLLNIQAGKRTISAAWCTMHCGLGASMLGGDETCHCRALGPCVKNQRHRVQQSVCVQHAVVGTAMCCGAFIPGPSGVRRPCQEQPAPIRTGT
jgi:hypothetical protein